MPTQLNRRRQIWGQKLVGYLCVPFWYSNSYWLKNQDFDSIHFLKTQYRHRTCLPNTVFCVLAAGNSEACDWCKPCFVERSFINRFPCIGWGVLLAWASVGPAVGLVFAVKPFSHGCPMPLRCHYYSENSVLRDFSPKLIGYYAIRSSLLLKLTSSSGGLMAVWKWRALSQSNGGGFWARLDVSGWWLPTT